MELGDALDDGEPQPDPTRVGRAGRVGPKEPIEHLRQVLGAYAAARELTRGIELHGSPMSPRPDVYLDRARALAAEGGEHVDEAIHGLDEGARRLGGAITLQLLAIDIEVRERRWDAALERLAAIEASSPRKESWLAHRGEVLLAAGRTDDARRVFQDALAAIAALPPHRRGAPVMAALDARVHAALSSPCLAGDSQRNERE